MKLNRTQIEIIRERVYGVSLRLNHIKMINKRLEIHKVKLEKQRDNLLARLDILRPPNNRKCNTTTNWARKHEIILKKTTEEKALNMILEGKIRYMNCQHQRENKINKFLKKHNLGQSPKRKGSKPQFLPNI